MKRFEAAYLPIGVPTFHLESAQKAFEDSISLLKSLSEDVTVPEEMLLSIDKLQSFFSAQLAKFFCIHVWNINAHVHSFSASIIVGASLK